MDNLTGLVYESCSKKGIRAGNRYIIGLKNEGKGLITGRFDVYDVYDIDIKDQFYIGYNGFKQAIDNNTLQIIGYMPVIDLR
jgi:hypothetical protein